MPGSAGGIAVTRDVTGATPLSAFITQDTSGVGSAAEAGDRFGASVG